MPFGLDASHDNDSHDGDARDECRPLDGYARALVFGFLTEPHGQKEKSGGRKNRGTAKKNRENALLAARGWKLSLGKPPSGSARSAVSYRTRFGGPRLEVFPGKPKWLRAHAVSYIIESLPGGLWPCGPLPTFEGTLSAYLGNWACSSLGLQDPSHSPKESGSLPSVNGGRGHKLRGGCYPVVIESLPGGLWPCGLLDIPNQNTILSAANSFRV